jgi:hypothetical protein
MAKQRLTATLDERIAAVLSADSAATSSELEQLYDEIEGALPSAEAQATAARARSLNPTTVDAAGARAAAQDLAFRVERLKAALPPLARALVAVREREAYNAWLPQYEAVQAEVAALAQEFCVTYPECVNRLIDLFQRAAAVDAKVEQVNGAATNLVNEHRRLLGVELTARKLNGFTGSNPSLAEKVQLPAFVDSARMLWPPRTVPAAVLIAESVARSMSGMPNPAHDLVSYHRAQDDARRDEAQRHANYYDRLNAEREEEESMTRIAEQEAMFSE